MVVVKLTCGLGNQMFQYAFAIEYIKQGIEVKFDISNAVSKHGTLPLEIIFKNIELSVGRKRDVFYFFEKIKNENGEREYFLKEDMCLIEEPKEKEFTYDSSLISLDKAYMIGYWQNEKYFRKNIDLIKTAFQFERIENKEEQNFKIQKFINSVNSVGIHIRRGDYLQSYMHRNLPIEYYNKAIQIIKKNIKNPFFFVFSDDIKWAKESIKVENIFFVEGNLLAKSHIDMQLMSMCKHNIIANSTFSWWSAWLNNNPQKIIIAPQDWFNTDIDVNGLLLDNWIII